MVPMAKPSPQMRALAGALQDCGGEAALAKKLGDMYLKARELAAVRRR
jgi:hypothetical protein